MSRAGSIPGGKLEEAVLMAVWDSKQATTPEVHARVGQPRQLAYTTTAKVLDRLYAKGLIARRRVGRTFVYRPQRPRAAVERARVIAWVRRLFGSDPRPSMATLVDAMASIDPALLEELTQLVEVRRRSRRGS